jgi:hypothetical protein
MAQPFDAETAGNAEEIEQQFAVKTVEHLEVSFQRGWMCQRGSAWAGGGQMRDGSCIDSVREGMVVGRFKVG